jgi:hypothetical protein
MTMMIGGKCDGHEVPAKVLTMTEKGETYLLMSFKHEGVKHYFYMLTGGDLTPAQAQKTYCVRAGLVKPRVEIPTP